MKPQTTNRAFTAVELLVVVSVLALLAGMLLPALSKTNRRAPKITCVNNLKQIGIGFRLYAADGEPYPAFNETNQVWQYFQMVSNYMGSPKVLICPEEAKLTKREHALDFETPSPLTPNNFSHPSRQNNSLSYFYSPDALEEEPTTVLAGDRNLSTNKATISGMITVVKNTPIEWNENPHDGSGNILFVDGSTQQTRSAQLREQFQLNTNITQRLLIP